MSTPRNARTLLDSRFAVDRIIEDLESAGYDDVYEIRLAGYSYIAGVSPTGMRFRLECLEDVGAALDLPVGPPSPAAIDAALTLPTTTDHAGAPVSIGSTVTIDDTVPVVTGVVRKIAKSGSVTITGWRGYLRPERITVVEVTS